MYLVVSRWEAAPGREAEFERLGLEVAALLRRQPGVRLLEEFKSDNTYVSVHGYEDEATYRALINDPDGVFARAVAERRLEELGRWLGSERGETFPYE